MMTKKTCALLIAIYGVPGIILFFLPTPGDMIGARLLLLSFLSLMALIAAFVTSAEQRRRCSVFFVEGFQALERGIFSGIKKITPSAFHQTIGRFSFERFIATETGTDNFTWRELLRPSSFLLPLLLMAGALVFDWQNQKLLYYALLAWQLFLYLRDNKAMKWWAFIALSITIIVNGYYQGHDFDNTTYLLFKHWFAFHVLRYRLWYGIPAIAFFLSMQEFWFPWQENWGILEALNVFVIQWLVALYVMRFKYGYVYTLFIFVLILDSSFPAWFTDNTTITPFESFLTALPYVVPPLLLWYHKEISHFYKLVIVLVVVLSYFDSRGFNPHTIFFSKPVTTFLHSNGTPFFAAR